jgi:hypothetical protein
MSGNKIMHAWNCAWDQLHTSSWFNIDITSTANCSARQKVARMPVGQQFIYLQFLYKASWGQEMTSYSFRLLQQVQHDKHSYSGHLSHSEEVKAP